MQIGEISKITGVSISTLRYYDKHGLLKNVNRTKGGIRVFTDADIEALQMIHCLKSSGLTIQDIKQFMDWCALGDETIDTRLNFMYKQEENIKNQMNLLTKSLKLIEFKQWYYETAKKEGTEQHVKNMKVSAYPSHIQKLYKETHER